MNTPMRCTAHSIFPLLVSGLFLCSVAYASRAGTGAADPHEHAFMQENDTAMTRMMSDMSIKPSGDVDRDFVAMMAPHHQGAIDMAKAELRYGHNEQLRRIAQEIIVDQQQEIAAMNIAIGAPLPPSQPAPTQPADKHAASHPMPMSMPMK
ncbi:DUF305 domain-containing protein [Paraburkholderia sp. C35]|uniref:DUF305 domain-containing protein n=1 Tax=Paraburkholderia sp. C35 TaxID=2126993 RepID=UPI000D69164B|nr:DUF305 domain-containing protein [Paraburkholderia sp. C35]